MINSQWLDFLTQQGFSIDQENGQATLEQASAESAQPQLVPLTHWQLLALDGPDGEKFLQGQVSCDLRELSTSHSLLGSNCTPKGSVISFFRLCKIADEHLFLRLPRSLTEKASANFNKYIVFSKAKLSDANDYVGIGLQGDGAEALLQQHFATVPEAVGEQSLEGELLLVRTAGLQPRFELWAPLNNMLELWPQLAGHFELATTNSWNLADIRAGVAVLDQHSQEEYIPQMLNLHAVDAVNFHKGCYTGQEIVTRLQYRGKLKKCLYRLQLNAEQAPAVGSLIYSPEREHAGEVVAVAQASDNCYELQAVINIANAEQGDLRLHDANGPILEVLPLPYSIDDFAS